MSKILQQQYEDTLRENEKLITENGRMRDLLLSKVAIAKVSADNDGYYIPISIAEAEKAVKGGG